MFSTGVAVIGGTLDTFKMVLDLCGFIAVPFQSYVFSKKSVMSVVEIKGQRGQSRYNPCSYENDSDMDECFGPIERTLKLEDL